MSSTATVTLTETRPADASGHFATGTRMAGPLFQRADVAEKYSLAERHTGTMSRPVLVYQGMDNLKVPYGRWLSVLDMCCGTGVTTDRLQGLLKEQGLQDKVKVTCGDLSPQQLNYLDARIERNGWKNTKTVLMNAEVCLSSFSHISAVLSAMRRNFQSAPSQQY